MTWRPPGVRPSLTPEELEVVARRLMAMTSADTVQIALAHEIRGVTRIQANRVDSNSDQSAIRLRLITAFGGRAAVTFDGSRIDDASLQQMVAYTERASRESRGLPIAPHMRFRTKSVPAGTVWHQSTVSALSGARYEVLAPLIEPVVDAKCVASAFVGGWARSVVLLSKDGVCVSGHETDSEITVTAWTPDQSGVGWAGQASRDWSTLDPTAVAAHASDLASRSANPVAIEPGRRTVVFGPAAMAQFAHQMPYAWSISATLMEQTPFCCGQGDGKTKLREKVMDRRVTITSDPADPEGGTLPIFGDGADGSPIVPETWVESGILKNLAFDPGSAAGYGVVPANDIPRSFRLGQGTATVESMIAQCQDGLYVNRVANLSLMDTRSGLVSGVTHGGCFLIRAGKIVKAVKNLRFVDSPFVFLNNLIEIGTPHRAAMGYTPGNDPWPLPPMIVPPMMVRDFNFTMLADAV